MFFTGRLFDLETQRLKSTKCPIIFHFWLRGMWKNNKSWYNKTNPIYFEQFSGYLKSKSYLMTMAPCFEVHIKLESVVGKSRSWKFVPNYMLA